MKTHYFILCISIIGLFCSFDDSKACEYAGSNIGYVKAQTKKAIDTDDINISRYYAYKALNAIENSRKQFEDCGCEPAVQNIYEGLSNLKLATRVASLNGTKILLHRALENAMMSLEELEVHDEQHQSKYSNNLLVMNTTKSELEQLARKQPQGILLEHKIDKALVNFENSLHKVVTSVECKEAYDFAMKIYMHCEQQLLKPDLTEAKKYYNLRTKEITAAALLELEYCR
ncbi:MAG TPA: hypothetical protein VKN36_13570 [Eudoraea sp.]|nr:hypothetical protein [Eudoraea sp.]